ncbi:ATP adenylyltransferase family protein [Aromatoleum aromaticum]|uniref:Ap4A phosphorylase II n=1 Tax=Aromatoleum aromaticum (strain DSM 19018 / LMG 30748 / EbN1) TaxID=76114 RepID=Q5P0Q7_AROAE|nr:DUF4922 domain-containing protein [Aromatoleum aromaticum]NMG55721.1 phosphorylase [Aromatoleum aromaticum]CAI09107.1 Ap4A phosphorylase II [Aromatoleum aromaticum EbN1]
MPLPLLPRIDRTYVHANESGALQPIRTERALIRDEDFDFTVRWVSSLALKDAGRVSAALRRDPDHNPFLPPEEDLNVGPVGKHHLAVLNKYPVIERHLLIVTQAFESQTTPLSLADFVALARVTTELGGLGFYNGGTEAGASQRHKHLQWIPGTTPASSNFDRITARLPVVGRGEAIFDAKLPWRHRFVRLRPAPPGSDSAALNGAALHQAFHAACAALGLAADRDPMPPYNMLTGGGWLVVVPRSREQHEGISVNALGFAGSLFVRRPEQIDVVRRIGPLHLLTSVGFPA